MPFIHCLTKGRKQHQTPTEVSNIKFQTKYSEASETTYLSANRRLPEESLRKESNGAVLEDQHPEPPERFPRESFPGKSQSSGRLDLCQCAHVQMQTSS